MNCCLRITFWIVRQGFNIYDWMFSQKYEKVSNHVSASKLPWLFIGVELHDGTLLDKTVHAQYLVDSGIPVTPRTVCSSIDQQVIKRCFYLDAKTLKEEEIPAEGITIE
jgi:hypothetical protein